MTADTGASVALPTNVKRVGYTFNGWDYTDENGSSHSKVTSISSLGPGVDSAGVYGYSFTPNWTLNEFTIQYKITTDSPSDICSVSSTSETVSAATPAAGSTASSSDTAKYVFVGWYTDDAHTSAVASGTMVSVSGATITPLAGDNGSYADATYYAYFEPVNYNVTFEVGTGAHGHFSINGTAADTQTYTEYYFGKSIADIASEKVISVVPDTGYTHTGWIIDGTEHENNTSLSGYTVPAHDVSIIPIFTSVTAKINYVTCGTATSPTTPASYNQKTTTWDGSVLPVSTFNSTTFTRTGYNFDGWYADSGLTKQVTIGYNDSTFADAITVLGSTPADYTITLYAKWTAKGGYTVVYDATNGTSGTDYPSSTSNPANKTSVTWETTNLLPSLTAPNGWTLNGWYLDGDATKTHISDSAAYGSLASSDADSSITLVADELWITAVTPAPSRMPRSGVPESR